MMNSLRIEDYSLRVHLGCEKEEREHLQEVRVTVEIRFHELLAAVRSDDLKETVCYAELCEALRRVGTSSEFKLIEKLAWDCLESLRHHLPAQAQIALKIHKVNPPVDGLLGGSRFSVGDFWL